VKVISEQNQNGTEISMKDQMKKFLLKSLYGFNTVLMFGLGRRLGIFDYLYDKARLSGTGDNVSMVTFTPDEISKKLSLDPHYVDAWIHLALECDILEIVDTSKKCLKTAPYVYNLLINRNNSVYIGDTLGAFYYIASFQERYIDAFKTGNLNIRSEFQEEMEIDMHRMSGRFGILVEGLFAKNFKDFCNKLRNNGKILAVGCGYGYNLVNWAKKYENVQFEGIDIDPKSIAYAKKTITKYNWNDRIKLFTTTVSDYVYSTNEKFDMILMNQVLHEMDPDENYRKSVFKDLYSLLRNNGILLVGESMVPDTFAPDQKFHLFDITHKFLEVKFARFYNDKSFKEFVDSTPFTRVDFIKEGGNSIWVIRK
jgi:ubiquinone/menaquinone biosynthesis C-methylase UbiE